MSIQKRMGQFACRREFNIYSEKIFGEELTLKVIRPEEFIGLKVRAIANDETRKAVDFADIYALMLHYGIKSASEIWPESPMHNLKRRRGTTPLELG